MKKISISINFIDENRNQFESYRITGWKIKMELVGKKVEEGWVKTQWNLRRPVGWSEICNVVSLLYNQFHQTELLTSVTVQANAEIAAMETLGNDIAFFEYAYSSSSKVWMYAEKE